jgi:hypothetical protein
MNWNTFVHGVAVVAETVHKLNKGALISDEDLKLAIRILDATVTLISAFGPEYRLFLQDLNEKLSKLKDFRQARKGVEARWVWGT